MEREAAEGVPNFKIIIDIRPDGFMAKAFFCLQEIGGIFLLYHHQIF